MKGWVVVPALLMMGCPSTIEVKPPEEARAHEVAGQWRAAWDAWVLRAARDPALATVKLLSLVDQLALTASDLAAIRALPEVAEQVAARLGDAGALAEARAGMGARYAVDADGVRREVIAGWLTGARRYTLTAPTGVVEVRSEASFVVRGVSTVTVDRGAKLWPTTVRIPTDGSPLTIEADPSARMRVLLHASPAITTNDIDAFDRALADGDIERADASLQLIPRTPAWEAVVNDAERRFDSIDTTRPADLLEPATPTVPSIADAPTSCLAYEAYLVEENEALRYRPAEVEGLAQKIPALVGSCARALLQCGDLMLDTFQLDAADALAQRMRHDLDPGPETEAAEALRARTARARAAPAPARAPAAALDLGLPLVDGAKLVAASAPITTGQTVLLDDRYVHVADSGRVTIRTHVVTCAGDAATTEALGELELPDDAEVILARTWRRTEAGLRALEPEEIAEKDTISLPALVPGDCAEWAFYRELLPDPRLPRGAFLLDPVTFDRSDATVLLARLRVRATNDPAFAVDPRVTATHPEPTLWLFEAKDLAPRVPEPLDPRPELRLVQVSAWGGFEREAWIAKLRADVRPNLRVTPSVRRIASRMGPSESPRDKLAELHRAVVESIEQASENPRAANASWAAARGRGERAMVLVAACAAVALPCDLVLARPLSEGANTMGAPDPEGFVYPLVRARIGPEATWIDPSNPHLDTGLIPPLLQDSPAIVLAGSDETLITTPLLAEQGHRKVTIKGTLAPDGTRVIFEGREELDGVYAASWRQALDAIAPEARERLFGSIVMQALPGASVDDVAIELSDHHLVWTWKAHANTEGAGGRARGVKLALMPEVLARGTVLLPQRATPLLINRSAALELDLTFELPAGWLFLRAPQPKASVEHAVMHLERSAEVTQDVQNAATPARLVIHKSFDLRPTVIAPEGYAAWKDAALEVDRADYLQLVVSPLPPRPDQ